MALAKNGNLPHNVISINFSGAVFDPTMSSKKPACKCHGYLVSFEQISETFLQPWFPVANSSLKATPQFWEVSGTCWFRPFAHFTQLVEEMMSPTARTPGFDTQANGYEQVPTSSPLLLILLK